MRPTSVYLVGRIAPVKLTGGTDDPADADTDEPGTDVGDADDARDGPGRAGDRRSTTDGADGGRGQRPEDEPQQRGLMIPASMGLRFQIPDDLESFTVTASWGVYEPVTDGGRRQGRTSAGTSAPRSRSPRRSPSPT